MFEKEGDILGKLYPFDVITPKKVYSEEMKRADMVALSIVLRQKPLSLLEIGAWTGSCTCLFGETLRKYGGKVYSIDNFKGSDERQFPVAKFAKQIFLRNIKNFGLEDTVTLLEGDSNDFADLDMKFDMVFIDGDHRYSQVKKDIENYLPKVNEGGILGGHDLESAQCLEEYAEQDCVNGVHHGVIKAVHEKFNGKVKVLLDGDNRTSSIWYVIKGGEDGNTSRSRFEQGGG